MIPTRGGGAPPQARQREEAPEQRNLHRAPVGGGSVPPAQLPAAPGASAHSRGLQTRAAAPGPGQVNPHTASQFHSQVVQPGGPPPRVLAPEQRQVNRAPVGGGNSNPPLRHPAPQRPFGPPGQ